MTPAEPSYQDDDPREGVNDWDVAAWEEEGRELQLYVCAGCGLISSEAGLDHGEECTLGDWWHLNARCFVKPEKEPNA